MVSSRITQRAFLVDSLGLGNPGTVAVYVVKGPSKTAVIDCGYASSYENVLQGLRDLGVDASSVDYLIPTHVHLDHAGGAGHLLRHMPRAKVIAHDRAVPHLVDPKRLVDSATSVFGEGLIRMFGRPLPIDGERISAVGEEAHLELGGGCTLTTIHAPGHAPHQISVLFEEEHLLFSADAVGILFPSFPTMIPATPPPSLDPASLAKTLERLGQTDPKMLLVPHYGPRDDVKAVLDMTRERTDGWVTEVRRLKDGGAQVEQIISGMKRKTMEEAGLAHDVPGYVDVQIRISVLGILHYLGKADGAPTAMRTTTSEGGGSPQTAGGARASEGGGGGGGRLQP